MENFKLREMHVGKINFERNYQELWRNHVEIKRPNDGVVYDEFLFIRERMKLTQTSHQRNG